MQGVQVTAIEPDVQPENKKSKYRGFEELLAEYCDPVRAMTHQALERFIEEEIETFLHTTGIEGDKRNGYRFRKEVFTECGPFRNIQIPRNRQGGFVSEILPRFKRRIGKINKLISALFIEGLATRRIRRALGRVWGNIANLSSGTVSRITQDLVGEHLRWANRPITKQIEFLLFDGVGYRIRRTRMSREIALVALGISNKGEKEILDFIMVTREKEITYDELILRMIKRGLDPKKVKLVLGDGNGGLANSVRNIFGEKKFQRCTVHKTRNVMKATPKEYRPELKAKLHRMFNAPSRMEARKQYAAFVDEYRVTFPKTVGSLEEGGEDLFRYYDFPARYWKTIRNTNLIERTCKELRRRTKPWENVHGEFNGWKVIFGIVSLMNESWAGRSHWKKGKRIKRLTQ